ncbi:glycosyltransferase [Adlercreutzia murintestinalis]|uniref:glycosyltransferase n=1 Tax=Adlercreutzia murintestinalis TaxID=2941325 RepID=UPI0020421CBF|nr:glycosyltransferase [Adlercreutzia murintestinalis]
MNPVVIVPTFITSPRRRSEAKGIVANYDHTTDINQPGELERCLESLTGVEGIGVVLVLVVADHNIEAEANAKVRATVARFPELDAIVVGQLELDLVRQRMQQLGIDGVTTQIGLRGYGAVRNMGLVLACTLGFDAAVFIDDDEIIDDPAFLRKAMYGLGKLTKKGIPILAKTGYYLNDQGSFLSKWEDKWYNRFWQQGRAFNEWIRAAMQGPRISRSNHVCGGCLAVHKEAFKRLSFDPWIPRGEDLDYLLSLRMYGSDIWFDNQWQVRHLPPPGKSEGNRFRQDIFRWMYEHDKLEYSHSIIDLQKITPASLRPYPGPFLEKGLRRRIWLTALLRSLGRPDKKAYRAAARVATGEATKYAHENCTKYFEFQYVWPDIMDALDSDKILTSAIVRSSLHGEDAAPIMADAHAAQVDARAAGHTRSRAGAELGADEGTGTGAGGGAPRGARGTQEARRVEREVPDVGPLSKAHPIDPGKTTALHLDMGDQ